MKTFLDDNEVLKFLDKKGDIGVLDEFVSIKQNYYEVMSSIPAFFYSFLPDQPISRNFVQYIRNKSLKSISDHLPTEKDVLDLRNSFDRQQKSSSSLPSLGIKSSNKVMRYQQYMKLREEWPENIRKILSAKLFQKIGGNSSNNIFYESLFSYLLLVSHTGSHINNILGRDVDNSGYISASSFREYVVFYCQDIVFSNDICEFTKAIYDDYVSAICCLIFNVVDPLQTGSISIEILFQQPLYFQLIQFFADKERGESKSIFGQKSIFQLIKEFQYLDENDDGMLDSEDLLSISTIKLTRTFAESLIDAASGEKGPGFDWYVRFRASWDNIGQVWSNSFFFSAFDIRKNGFLSSYEIGFFLKESLKIFELKGHTFPAEPIVSEIFDQFGVDDMKIPKERFVNYVNADQIIKLLGDSNYLCRQMLNCDIDNIPQL